MAKADCEHEPNTHCIHSSERRSFRSCRQRWYWNFVSGYVPQEMPKPLEMGIAFHEGMEQIYEPSRWDDTSDQEKLDAGIARFTEVCEKQKARFLKVTGQTKLNQAYGDDYQERIDLGIGMMTHYMKEVHPSADKWFKPVAVEVAIATDLYYPDVPMVHRLGKTPGDVMRCYNSPNCGQIHDDGAPVTLNGRVDALLEDLAYGGYYVADWKTAAQLIVHGEFLQLDDQITSYCGALQHDFNLDIRGFMYAEFKKAFPQPLKKLTRLQQGRKLSTAKDQPTTYAVALESIMDIDPEGHEAGFYDDYLAELQGPHAPKFHQRFPVVQSNTKLKNVLVNVATEALDITNPELLIYTAASKNNCGACAYQAPCLGKQNGEDYQYTLKSAFRKRGTEH